MSDELRRFRLAPMQSQGVGARFGLGDEWRASPLALAAAYRELSHAPDAGAKEVLEGMRRAALSGTAAEVDRALRAGKSTAGALAKTGTAPCTHAHRAQADGFTLVMYPAESPRFLLLVRQHGVTGSHSSHAAAAMLRLLISPQASPD
jgi:cell division protein FtsI/penicillin-binding protein 2